MSSLLPIIASDLSNLGMHQVTSLSSSLSTWPSRGYHCQEVDSDPRWSDSDSLAVCPTQDS